MNFPHIVALLDEELERLQSARAILSTLHPILLPKQERSPRPPKQASASPPDGDDSVAPVETPAEPAPTTQPVIVRAARQQVRRARRSRPLAPAPPPGPLGPSSHSRPVFVRAELLTPRPQSASAKTDGTRQQSEMTPVLTAEALAKRWLSTPSL